MANYDGTNFDGWTLEQGTRAAVEGADRTPSGGTPAVSYSFTRGILDGVYVYWTSPTDPAPAGASNIAILQRWTA
jgi:hypothetical protein